MKCRNLHERIIYDRKVPQRNGVVVNKGFNFGAHVTIVGSVIDRAT